VRSKSDVLINLQNKMSVWLKNGAQLAWLIDPREKITFIYRPGKEAEVINGLDKKIAGEGPVESFMLDLSLLRT
jgi:Uma2 family endonuclease